MNNFTQWDVVVIDDIFYEKYHLELRKVLSNRTDPCFQGKCFGFQRPFVVLGKHKKLADVYWVAPLTTSVAKYLKIREDGKSLLDKYPDFIIKCYFQQNISILDLTNIFVCSQEYFEYYNEKVKSFKEKECLFPYLKSKKEVLESTNRLIGLIKHSQINFAWVRKIEKKLQYESSK